VFNIFKQRLTKNKKALQSSNVIKSRKEPSSEMDLALFYKKVEEFLKKWLTKRQKCAGDFISKLIKSPAHFFLFVNPFFENSLTFFAKKEPSPFLNLVLFLT
jgi:hypothetical protein